MATRTRTKPRKRAATSRKPRPQAEPPILERTTDTVAHPPHYGGGANPREAIKVIEEHGLNFHTGNAVKYILRAGKKHDELEDLKKALWYLNRRIMQLEQGVDVPAEL